MRKLLILLILLNLVISCSKDEKNNEQVSIFPTNITFSTQSAEIGQILKINGNGFLVNETYEVVFDNNISGIITEINNSFLKVEIPENTVSGNISLHFREITKIIGIINIVDYTSNLILFATKDYIPEINTISSKLITINIENGQETELLDLQTPYSLENLVYNKQNNTILTIASNTDMNDAITNILYKINTANNTYTTSQLNADGYYNIVLFSAGTLFATKDYTPESNTMSSKLISINIENGQETELLNLQTTYSLESLVYNEQSNTILAIASNTDMNDAITNILYKINTTNKTYTTSQLSTDGYYEISLSNAGTLFATKDYAPENNTESTKLVSINIQNGQETELIDLQTTYSLKSLVYNEQNNTIMAIASNTDINDAITNILYKINTTDNTFITSQLNNEGYYEITINQ